MYKKYIYLLFAATAGVFFSCKPKISTEALYGQWNYIKVENTGDNPADTLSADELKTADPSISFSKNGDLVIMWDKKPLSTGKFILEGNYIQYTENLADGSKRTFPFFIRALNEDALVFETKGAEGTRVSANRAR
ncbi:MAG: hypothetical protein ACOH2A_13120 [Sphingobacteriaceae bacterium]